MLLNILKLRFYLNRIGVYRVLRLIENLSNQTFINKADFAYPKKSYLTKRLSSIVVEAAAGIEPAYTALQAAA